MLTSCRAVRLFLGLVVLVALLDRVPSNTGAAPPCDCPTPLKGGLGPNPVGSGLPAPFVARRPPLPPAPPPPEEHDITIRYRIEGARNDRLLRYFRLMEELAKAGFVRSPDDSPSELEPEDTRHTLLKGSIARAKVGRVLDLADVQAVLLLPKGKTLPAAEEAVRIELRLAGGLPLAQQRDLHTQVAQALNGAGIGEAIAYDSRQFTRFLAQTPAGKVPLLLEDLRSQPYAWPLLPRTTLTDLRKAPGGLDWIERVFDAWQQNAEGKKLILDNVALWQATPPALDFLKTLPLSVTTEPTVLIETQIRHFARHPEAADLLTKMFDEMRKSDAAPALMGVLLQQADAVGLTASLPILYRAAPPVRIVEAQPDLPLPAVPAAPMDVPVGQEKFTPDLRQLLGDADAAVKPRRFEMLLTAPLNERDRRWADRYASLPVGIEGRLGSIITVYGPPNEAAKLAELPEVMAVRLPRRADEARYPEKELKVEAGDCDKRIASLVRQYANAGRLRQVVLIGADFRGWEAFKGEGLPASTRLLDLTRERNREITPDPYPGDPKETGPGTRAALALASMAGTTDLLLVRVDPETPYLVDYVARLTAGEPEVSLALQARLRDLENDRRELDARGERLLEERNRILTDFRPEAEKLRQEYAQKQADFNKDRVLFEARQARFLEQEKLTNQVRKMRVVWNTLSWDEGYPLFDSGALSRYLDDRPYPGVWLQSRGGDIRRIWSGMFRDGDVSGYMDTLPPGEFLQPGRWNPDMGFLAWRNDKGERTLDLPAGAVIRLAVQWKEVHDADLARLGEDFYREPLSKLDLEVFRQFDPAGKKQPADDLALLVRSSGPPQRLLSLPRFAIYEQAIEFKVEEAGRYLIRLPGSAPESTRPKNLTTIPIAREVPEMHPRVVLRTITGAGEAIFEDPPPSRPNLPMPADAWRAVPLGAN